jgi:broad specificity phosphatase PhoE
MPKCEIYLLRHGEVEHYYRGRLVGQVDALLTDKGLHQAQSWGKALSDVQFRGIFCSDLTRAIRTAEIIAGGSQSLIKVLPQLREINLGEWDGLTHDEVKMRSLEGWDSRGRDLAGYRPPGGESFLDLSSRIIPVFEEIVFQTEGKILIVGHAGVNRTILCHVLGMPLVNLLRICQDYACLNIIERSEGSFRLRIMNVHAGEPHSVISRSKV